MNKTHKKYKLKQIAAATIGAVALGFQGQVFALGLSEINVNSYLGQPLKASITVLGANELNGTSCLSAGPNSDLQNISFKLGPISGDKATLLITSPQAINEPIVNLSVVAGCDITIARDYVLLLDPPLSGLSSDVNSPIVQKIDTSDDAGNKIFTAEKAKPSKKSSAKPKRKKKVNSSRFANKQRPKAKTAQTSQIARVYLDENEPTSKGKPRLSISGGQSSYAYSGNTSLRLERQLRFKPDPNAPAIQDIELDDEITVMNNRLKHLQEQITKLQTQNNALQSDNKLKTEQLAKVESKTGFFSALPLLGTLLLLSAGCIAWLLRRRKAEKQDATDGAWRKLDERAEPSSPAEKAVVKKKKQPVVAKNEEQQTQEPKAVVESTNENEGLFDDVDINFGLDSDPKQSMESHFESSRTSDPAILLEDEEAFSVLDHADVFLSHGRSTLAIQLLQNHLLEHPKQSVTIWLFLLDLLQKEKLQAVYEEAAAECKLHFNVEVVEYSENAAELELSDKDSLEDFPHLAKGLEKVWGTSAAIVYLDDLIYNNRLEPRAGLPKKVFEELVLLRSMAQEGVNTADVIHLDATVDEKKLAMKEEKEALLEAHKAKKLKTIADAEKRAKEKANKDAGRDDETDFEFTLVD